MAKPRYRPLGQYITDWEISIMEFLTEAERVPTEEAIASLALRPRQRNEILEQRNHAPACD
jgi:hypothetical protein